MASSSSDDRPSLGKRLSTFVFSSVDSSLGTASYLAERADRIVSSDKEPASGQEGTLSDISRAIERLQAQIKRGSPIENAPSTISAILDALANHGAVDDRELLLEAVLVAQSRLPLDGAIAKKLRHKTNNLLWKDLPHPPSTLVDRSHKFRSADGSGTSIWFPDMGKAGSPYARSVTSTHPVPADQLPDAGLLFDTLLCREKHVPHPAGLSSFFFAFANLVIHEIFNTEADMETGAAKNRTSSYVDLAIIYGNNLAEQMDVRVNDGTGFLHPDTFADTRLLRMAPATPALLVLFSRNHNYVANRLLEINERGKWTKNIASLNQGDREKQDEEIFQTTRLIMCGFFISIVLGDYLSGILGLVRDGTPWSLDILEELRDDTNQLLPRGEGNHLSIEFVALYHWHATVSKADEEWAKEAFTKGFRKNWEEIAPADFIEMGKRESSGPRQPARQRTFGKLQRGKDGRFNDDELADVLAKAVLEPANAFGARSTPRVMRAVEIMGIELNRKWGACSLNEFRKFLGLKPFTTFDEWNDNPKVAEAARRLYKDPDNLELYVGLQAESAKPVVPGAGLCPGYTVSRGILADAIALTRGDRFLTTDFTAFNLTTWGINECKRNPISSSFGGMFSRVLTRALPNHFPADSVMTCFPMITPNKMKEFLGRPLVQKVKLYTYGLPAKKSPFKPITTYDAAKAALESPQLAATYPEHAKNVLPGENYITTFNNPAKNQVHRKLILDTFAKTEDVPQYAQLMQKLAADLINENTFSLVAGSKQSVDIVGDVAKYLPVHFVASAVLGLPLKSKTTPSGLFYPQELHSMLSDIYEYIFMDHLEPGVHVGKRQLVEKHCWEIHHQVERHIRASTNLFSNLTDSFLGMIMGRHTDTATWLPRLAVSGKSPADLASNAVVLGTLMALELGQALVHVIDTLLQPAYRENVVRAAKSADLRSGPELKAYISESLRLLPAIGGVYRTATASTTLAPGVPVSEGDRLYISLRDANIDSNRFPDPQTLQANRGLGSTLYGDGLVRLVGESWILETILPVVKTVFSLKNLDRAPGNSGKLRSYDTGVHGTQQRTYLDKRQFMSPWSSSLTVVYEA